MPTMRDMALPSLAQCLVDVVDHGAEVRACGQRVLESPEDARALRGSSGVPPLAERTAQPSFLVPAARQQAIALSGEGLPRAGLQPVRSVRRLGLLQRFLDLEHFLQQLGRRLRFHGRALFGLAPLFEPDQILDPTDRIAQRPVCGVEPRRRVQDFGLALRGSRLVKVGVVAPGELVELALQLGTVDPEPARQSEHLEVIHRPLCPQKRERALRRARSPKLEDPATPKTTCRIHSSTSPGDRKSTRLNSSHLVISYAVFCLKKKKTNQPY